MGTDLVESPWHTIGPFFHNALRWDDGGRVAGPDVAGRHVTLVVRVSDLNGPVDDAMVETWQANSHGRYTHPADTRDLPLDPGFTGFGRTVAGPDGSHVFDTVLPGRVPGPGNTLQAAHIDVSIFARGLMQRLVTRVYFAGEPGLDEDPVLELVSPARRGTLLASPDGNGRVWHWNVRLRGEDETAFFEI